MAGQSRQKQQDDQRLLDETFGEVLREKRLALHLRQVDLETENGIQRSQISNIEKGISQICLRGLFQVAEALEESPEDLIAEVRSRFEKRKDKKIRNTPTSAAQRKK